MSRASQTPAGDVDYGKFGEGYARKRQPDPRIAAWIHRALGEARTVLNVGAGSGSYEPLDRHVVAVEPSPAMRAQRPRHLAPAIDGVAEDLPLDDQSVDASMALVTLHQWRDLEKGLAEMRRVTLGPILVLTFDGEAMGRYWLAEYAPELMARESRRMPRIGRIVQALGGEAEVIPIPIPLDCVDGFNEAYYGRPEAFLDPATRRSQSAWSFVPPRDEAEFVETLGGDLRSGKWDGRHGEWRSRPTYDGSLRLIVGNARGGLPNTAAGAIPAQPRHE